MRRASARPSQFVSRRGNTSCATGVLGSLACCAFAACLSVATGSHPHHARVRLGQTTEARLPDIESARTSSLRTSRSFRALTRLPRQGLDVRRKATRIHRGPRSLRSTAAWAIAEAQGIRPESKAVVALGRNPRRVPGALAMLTAREDAWTNRSAAESAN